MNLSSKSMHIRIATSLDQDSIYSVHWSAFGEDERDIVAKLAVNLLSEKTTPPTISLVAEAEDAIIGHVVFSPVAIENNTKFQGYILAPLGIKPEHQKHRIGSQLIEYGVQQLQKMDVDILFVYGDPKYYERFGFNTDIAGRYIPPYKLEYPFGWQGIALKEGSMKESSVKINCVASLCDPTLW